MKRRNASADYMRLRLVANIHIYINVNIFAPTTAKHHKVDNCRYTQTLCLNIVLHLDELCSTPNRQWRIISHVWCIMQKYAHMIRPIREPTTHTSHVVMGYMGLPRKGLVNVTHHTHTLICVYLWRCCTWVNNTFKMRKTTNSHTTKVIKSRIY